MYQSPTFAAWLRAASDAQLVRLNARILERCYRDYGVSSFDWPTLAAIYPERYAVLKALRREYWDRAELVIPDPCEMEA